MKKLINLFVSFAILIFVMVTTKPNVESPWLIGLFFLSYFSFMYFVGSYVLRFLHFQKRARLLSMVFASSMTTLQVLLTFKALRPLEVLLMVAVISLGGWYFSQAKS